MTSKIRVLYVGINYRYISPTISLLPAALSRNCTVHFYGPGYVSHKTLSRGVASFADSLDGVDLVVATKDIAGDIHERRLNRFLRRFVVLPSSFDVTAAVLQDMRTFLARHRQQVVISLMDVDIYGLSDDEIATYLSRGKYFFGWRKGALDLSGLHGELEKEPYIKVKRQQRREVGRYEHFSSAHGSDIIPMDHFVGDNEFAWDDISTRAIDVSVPGSRYCRRKSVSQTLKATGRFTVGGDRLRVAFQVASRLGLRPWASYYGTHVYNLAFQRLLARSKACVTDGGLLNFTIRKFVEIPAAGSLLICWPSNGLEGMGFKNGTNCIFVSDESDVLKAVENIADDPGAFQDVASAGRELVLREHSVAARGKQIFEAFGAILSPPHGERGEVIADTPLSSIRR